MRRSRRGVSRGFLAAVLLIAGAAGVFGLSLWMQPRERVPWRVNFQAATAEARRDNKPMLIDFTAAWCGPCQEMRRTTWSDSTVASALAGYVPVQVDIDAQPDIAAQFAVHAIPRLIVLDANGNVTKSSEGSLPADMFIAWLRSNATHELPFFFAPALGQ